MFICIKNTTHISVGGIDIHQYQLTDTHLNCHDMKLSDVEKIYSQVDKILREKYGICHVTIQAEYHRGKDEDFFDTVVDEEHLIK